MNPASNSRSGGREAPRASQETDTKNRQTTPNPAPSRTPATDVQPEDAGTAANGNDQRATASQSVMKQEQKTAHESGSRR